MRTLIKKGYCKVPKLVKFRKMVVSSACLEANSEGDAQAGLALW
jgi:hypothetical protein